VNEQEKLRVLIPHWIEHNEEHAKEFRRWADAMADANESLAAALEKLGGALDPPHHHHHSH
jgi:hypothetical protein